MRNIALLVLVMSLLVITTTVNAIENRDDINGFCNVVPAGVKVDIDLSTISQNKPENIADENDLVLNLNKILRDPEINHQSYISNIGRSVTFRSKSWTTPPTYMLHMAVNALLIYSPDLVNWYSTGMSVMVSETGYQATFVDAQRTVSVTGGRYYMTWGCPQGGVPEYHYDDYSNYIYVW
ncbi:MAG: hypothetical protein WC382_04600 [Methanoregulaceae archaeon]